MLLNTGPKGRVLFDHSHAGPGRASPPRGVCWHGPPKGETAGFVVPDMTIILHVNPVILVTFRYGTGFNSE